MKKNILNRIKAFYNDLYEEYHEKIVENTFYLMPKVFENEFEYETEKDKENDWWELTCDYHYPEAEEVINKLFKHALVFHLNCDKCEKEVIAEWEKRRRKKYEYLLIYRPWDEIPRAYIIVKNETRSKNI